MKCDGFLENCGAVTYDQYLEGDCSQCQGNNMNDPEGQAIPEKFRKPMQEGIRARIMIDGTLKVALDHHSDMIMRLDNDNQKLWGKVYEHFEIPQEERSHWYSNLIAGEWIMVKRNEDSPYRLEEKDG